MTPWQQIRAGRLPRRLLHLFVGQVVVATGLAVLLAWIPLRQAPGIGTIANAVWVGVATDVTLALVPEPDSLVVRVLYLTLGGVLLNGVASALYIGAQLGPGPRDGLMTGIARRTGGSLRLVRTCLEIAVLALGWLLGGGVGLGTVLYAVAIGPIVQFLLPWFIVEVDAPAAASPA